MFKSANDEMIKLPPSSDSPGEAKVRTQSVGLWTLVVIIFSNVGSGPAGIEGIIGSAGIIIGLLAIVVFPLFWGYVQAFLSAELSIQYNKHNGGLPAWCMRQNNKALAFNTALWILAIETSTAALVSEASVEYLRTVLPWFHSYGPRFGLSLAIIALSFCFNFVSIRFSTTVFKNFIAFTLVVFGLLVGFSVPHLDWSRSKQNPVKEYNNVDWALLVNLLIFNSAGFDAGGSIIAYVGKPRRTVPRAMVVVGFATTALYIVTLYFPYIAVQDKREDWQAGHLSVVALELGGKWLQALVIVACFIINLQVYSISLQTAAYTTAAMAEQNVFPKQIGVGRYKLTLNHRTSRDTPSHALVLCGCLSAVFAAAPFVVNLAIESVLYSAVMFAQAGCMLMLEEKGRLFVPQKRRWRLVVIVIPVLLATWVIVVQSRPLLLGMLSVVILVALASIGLDFTTEAQPSTTLHTARVRSVSYLDAAEQDDQMDV
jgi:amino acid transporter